MSDTVDMADLLARLDEHRPLTQKQAETVFNAGVWRMWTSAERLLRQLYQPYLVMPFHAYHAAVEVIAERGLWPSELEAAHSKPLVKDKWYKAAKMWDERLRGKTDD